jgi:hypothetical protein
MLANTRTMAAWISSPASRVVVRGAAGAAKVHAERHAIHAATPWRSSTMSPA